MYIWRILHIQRKLNMYSFYESIYLRAFYAGQNKSEECYNPVLNLLNHLG